METNSTEKKTGSNKYIPVLLIEDNPEDCLLIQEMLGLVRRFYFRITTASTIADGIAALNEIRPPAVLVDLNLPDSHGIDTFRRISQLEHKPAIILLTNLDDENLALRAIREGAQDYLLKSELSGDLLARSIRYAIERKRIEDRLRESQERFSLAVEGSFDGIWDWNLLTNKIFYSSRWMQMLGHQPNTLTDNPSEWFSRIHPTDLAQFKRILATHLDGRTEHFEAEYRIRYIDGEYRWMLARGIAVRNSNGRAYRIAGSQTDITQRKKIDEQLQFDAFHDALTGLPNRALFLDRLDRTMRFSKRRANYQYAVIFLDLDRFKMINDSLGHSFGDRLLVACGEKLQLCLRAVDTVSRFGGDEFVILLDNINDQNDAIEVAERIHHHLQGPIEISTNKLVVTASIGIVMGNQDYQQTEEILRDADIAMYNAKMLGKGCHVVFEEKMRQRIVSRLQIENQLRQAMDLKEITVQFQPVVSLRTWKIIGFEALARWLQPGRGFIPPKEFIPIAEETGLIHPLGMLVLRSACAQIREWQQKFPMDPPLSVSVNISGKQFSQPDFLQNIQMVLNETGLHPSCLSLEITESLFVEGNETLTQALKGIDKMGVNLQIDDFGTGYSSFAYLQHIHVSAIKIDSTFITQMNDDDNHLQIVRSIIALAKNLNLNVIAEGIESARQLSQLIDLGCSYGQGYYISRPLSADLCFEVLKRSKGSGRLIIPMRSTTQ